MDSTASREPARTSRPAASFMVLVVMSSSVRADEQLEAALVPPGGERDRGAWSWLDSSGLGHGLVREFGVLVNIWLSFGHQSGRPDRRSPGHLAECGHLVFRGTAARTTKG